MPGIVTNTVEDVEGGCGSPPQGNAEKNNGGAEACQIDKAMPTESGGEGGGEGVCSSGGPSPTPTTAVKKRLGPQQSLRFDIHIEAIQPKAESARSSVSTHTRFSRRSRASRRSIRSLRKTVSLATISTMSTTSVRRTRSQFGSRRMSRATDDEFDELAFMQQQMSSGDSCCSRFCSLASLLRLFPLRTHGIVIAAVSTIIGAVGVVVVAAAIVSTAAAASAAASADTLCEYSSADLASTENRSSAAPAPPSSPPFPAPSLQHLPPSSPPPKVGEDGIEGRRELNCSDSAVSSWLLSVFGINSEKAADKVQRGGGFARRPVSASDITVSRHPWLMWVALLALIVFVWSSANLGVGIWSEQRRRLVPWLLVAGVSILLTIMMTSWLLLLNRGSEKLMALLPASMGLLLLYWWLIINDLLEEIHGVKKADAAEEWADALDAAETAAIEGRPEVSSMAVAIAMASGHTRLADREAIRQATIPEQAVG